MQTHKEAYPEQYAHPMCGVRVRTKDGEHEYVVERVVNTSFGELAPLPGTEGRIAFALRDLEVVE